MRKNIAVTAAVVVLLVVTALVAHAASSWYQVNVNQVGTSTYCSGGQTKPALTVTGGGLTNATVWILASDTTQENRAMAIALTALAAGLKVAVYMDTSACGGSYYDCTSIHVQDIPKE
jgi:hypothetical protein